METQTNPSSASFSSSNMLASKASLASKISPGIMSTLDAFILETLGVAPHVKFYRALWECEWMNRAGELTIYLDSAGSDYFLQVTYIEKLMNPPAQRLQAADVQLLCQALQAQTDLPVRSSF